MKYWREILFVVTVASFYVTVTVMMRQIDSLRNDNSELKTEISLKEEAIRSRDQIISMQERAIGVMEDFAKREAKAEVRHTETIVNNKEIIKEYIESEKAPEDTQKLFDYKNSMYRDIEDILNWWKE